MERKNEERFTGKADAYKKFRPAYPKELIDYLYSQIGFAQESRIADIGSGHRHIQPDAAGSRKPCILR
jgi:hypothetical protein